MSVVRCVIVDDNQAFLEAATRLLEREGLIVAAVASTAADALAAVDQERPDVVLVDITLGLESGFEVARRLSESGARAKIILVSTHAEADFADLIDESSAVGFVPKSELSGEIVTRLANGPQEK